jgi:hypothetical protein
MRSSGWRSAGWSLSLVGAVAFTRVLQASGCTAILGVTGLVPAESGPPEAGSDGHAKAEGGADDHATREESSPSCEGGEKLCSGACVNEQTNATHCGACDKSCSALQACDGGSCVCTVSGQTLCGTDCVDLQTDSMNCGGCGMTCSVPCSGGECLVTIAPNQVEPLGITVNATTIYWVDQGSGTGTGAVMSAPLAGGTVTTVVSGESYPEFIALNSANLYWTTTLGIKSFPLGGGITTPIVSTGYPVELALTPTDIFWTDVNADGVLRIPLDGGTIVTINSDGDYPHGITVDTKNVYWTNGNGGGGSVVQAPLIGGTSTTLVNGLQTAWSVAVDATSVYWCTEISGGNVESTPIGGGASTTLASGQSAPAYLAVDSENVYWTNSGSGTVMKAPIGGGTATTLATGQSSPAAIVVDATSVYWTNDVPIGSVMRVTPK